jgi:hypothetical protein
MLDVFKEAKAKRDEVAERLKKLQEGEGLAQRRQVLSRAWTWAQVQECQDKVAEYEQHLLVTVRGAGDVECYVQLGWMTAECKQQHRSSAVHLGRCMAPPCCHLRMC